MTRKTCSTFARTLPNRRLRARCRAVRLAPRLRLRLHRPRDAGPSRPLASSRRWHSLIAIHRAVVLADQTVHHLGVVDGSPSSRLRCARRPLVASTPTCAFMPKYHWLPFFEECISGISLARLAPGGRRAAARLIIAPARHFVSSLRLRSRCRKFEDRRLVRDRIASEFEIAERAASTGYRTALPRRPRSDRLYHCRRQ